MAIKTQGTQLYKVATATTSIVITKLTNPTPPSGSADEIEITDLDSTAKEYLQGLIDYGEATFDINYDPADTSHQALEADLAAGTTSEWLIGFSDGTTAAPTVTASSFATPATSRSWVLFSGFVKGFQKQSGTNTKMTATLTVRVTGSPTYFYKA